MALKPNESLMASAAVVTAVFATFQTALPAVADERVAPSSDSDLASAERVATWTAAGLVSVISLLAKDPTIFVLGGMATVILAWTHRHANEVNPQTGRAATFMPRVVTHSNGGEEADDYTSEAM